MNEFNDCGDPIEGTRNVTKHGLHRWYENKIEKLGWMIINDSQTKVSDLKRYYCGLKKLYKTIELSSLNENREVMLNNIKDIMTFVKKYINENLNETATESAASEALELMASASRASASRASASRASASRASASRASAASVPDLKETLTSSIIGPVSLRMLGISSREPKVPTEKEIIISPKFTTLLNTRPVVNTETDESIRLTDMSEAPSRRSRTSAPAAPEELVAPVAPSVSSSVPAPSVSSSVRGSVAAPSAPSAPEDLVAPVAPSVSSSVPAPSVSSSVRGSVAAPSAPEDLVAPVAPSVSSSVRGSVAAPSAPEDLVAPVAPSVSSSARVSVAPSVSSSALGSVAPAVSSSARGSVAPSVSSSALAPVAPSVSSSALGSVRSSARSSALGSVAPAVSSYVRGSAAPSAPAVSSSARGSAAPVESTATIVDMFEQNIFPTERQPTAPNASAAPTVFTAPTARLVGPTAPNASAAPTVFTAPTARLVGPTAPTPEPVRGISSGYTLNMFNQSMPNAREPAPTARLSTAPIASAAPTVFTAPTARLVGPAAPADFFQSFRENTLREIEDLEKKTITSTKAPPMQNITQFTNFRKPETERDILSSLNSTKEDMQNVLKRTVNIPPNASQ
jgi:hypothetical protein